MGVDSGRGARGTRAPRARQSLPTGRLELIRIAPKSRGRPIVGGRGAGAGTSLRRDSLGASGPGTRRTCQALPGFPSRSKTPGMIWLLGGGGFGAGPARASCALGLPQPRAGAAGGSGPPSLRSAPPGSPPPPAAAPQPRKPRDYGKGTSAPRPPWPHRRRRVPGRQSRRRDTRAGETNPGCARACCSELRFHSPPPSRPPARGHLQTSPPSLRGLPLVPENYSLPCIETVAPRRPPRLRWVNSPDS